MRLYTRPMYYLYELMRNTHMKKEDLKRRQERMLGKVMENAYNNTPYYNKIFKTLDLKPGDLRNAEDLKKLPIISKQEIRDNIDSMISTKHTRESLIEYETSGSTGKPLPIYVNQLEDDYRKAKHLRSNIVVGQRPWDKYIVITSPSHYGRVPGILKRLGIFDREFISVFVDVKTQLKRVEEYNPDILAGYSSSLYLLAQEAERQGSDSIRPKFSLGGAELCDEYTRNYVRKVFDAPFIDQYAIVEVEKIAWQCLQQDEYHIDADSVIVEFVDDDGEEVAPGESGHIICTSLFNNAMPFIRYKIGDIGMPSDNECSCGITFPTMKIIEGRADSMLTLPGGLTLSPRNFAISVNHFEHIFLVDQWRVVQKKIDHFEIYLVLEQDANPTEIEVSLRSHMHKILNMDEDMITFDVIIVEDMPKDPTGKLRSIFSEVNRK